MSNPLTSHTATLLIVGYSIWYQKLTLIYITDLMCVWHCTDPKNQPGWSVPENQQLFTSKMPLFIKPLLLDITKDDTKVSSTKTLYLSLNTLP